jgi:hypothetical protein
MIDQYASADEVPLAAGGIVPCKVSAENGPIQPGDLLVTSSTPVNRILERASLWNCRRCGMRKGRILVAEDDRTARVSLVGLLEVDGFRRFVGGHGN